MTTVKEKVSVTPLDLLSPQGERKLINFLYSGTWRSIVTRPAKSAVRKKQKRGKLWAGIQHFLQHWRSARRRLRAACVVWSESSQDTLWVAKGPKRLQANIKDSDQPAHPGWSQSSLSAHAISSEMLCPYSYCIVSIRTDRAEQI